MSYFEEISKDFNISKKQIISVTTDGGMNIVSAVRMFLGEDRKIPCMAHTKNLICDVLKGKEDFWGIVTQVKGIVTYFIHSVSATDKLRIN